MDKTLQSQLTNPQTEREREIAQLGPWFHNLHLPDGTQTAPDHPLGDFPSFKWRQIAPWLPKELKGWSALDIGCNAGFYSFELARRGARVTAIDVNPHYLKQARWVASQYGFDEAIEFRQMQVYDLARCEQDYDLVWFMGVFYHLRYPVLGLDIVSRLAKRLMVFQSLMTPGEEVATQTQNLQFADLERMTAPEWPKMAFVEHRFEDDPTNWWLPNHACVEALLRSCSMEVVGRPAWEIYLCRPQEDLRQRNTLLEELRAATGQS